MCKDSSKKWGAKCRKSENFRSDQIRHKMRGKKMWEEFRGDEEVNGAVEVNGFPIKTTWERMSGSTGDSFEEWLVMIIMKKGGNDRTTIKKGEIPGFTLSGSQVFLPNRIDLTSDVYATPHTIANIKRNAILSWNLSLFRVVFCQMREWMLLWHQIHP